MATALLSLDNPSFEQDPLEERLERSIWFLGGLMTVHADAKSTGGQMALIEIDTRPGCEPPLHSHANEDELFYVLEGSLLVFRGNEQIVLEAGESAFLPREVPHTFKVLSPSAHWLTYITPGGFEGYFQTLGKPAKRLTPEENPAAPDVPRMLSLGEEFGLKFYL